MKLGISQILVASQNELKDCPLLYGFMTAYNMYKYVLENSMAPDKIITKLIYDKIDT